MVYVIDRARWRAPDGGGREKIRDTYGLNQT